MPTPPATGTILGLCSTGSMTNASSAAFPTAVLHRVIIVPAIGSEMVPPGTAAASSVTQCGSIAILSGIRRILFDQ